MNWKNVIYPTASHFFIKQEKVCISLCVFYDANYIQNGTLSYIRN